MIKGGEKIERFGLFFKALKPLGEEGRVILLSLLAGTAGGGSPKIEGLTVRVMESAGGKMESDPPWPVRALFQPGYRSHCDPPCLSLRTLSRQALINISTLLRQPPEGGTDGEGEEGGVRNEQRGKVLVLCFSKVHFIGFLKPN